MRRWASPCPQDREGGHGTVAVALGAHPWPPRPCGGRARRRLASPRPLDGVGSRGAAEAALGSPLRRVGLRAAARGAARPLLGRRTARGGTGRWWWRAAPPPLATPVLGWVGEALLHPPHVRWTEWEAAGRQWRPVGPPGQLGLGTATRGVARPPRALWTGWGAGGRRRLHAEPPLATSASGRPCGTSVGLAMPLGRGGRPRDGLGAAGPPRARETGREAAARRWWHLPTPLGSVGVRGPQKLASRSVEEEKAHKCSQGHWEALGDRGGSCAPGQPTRSQD